MFKDYEYMFEAEVADATDSVDDNIKDAFIDDPESDIALADEKKVKELIDKIPTDDEEECCEGYDEYLSEADEEEVNDEEVSNMNSEKIKEVKKEVEKHTSERDENVDQSIKDSYLDAYDDFMFEADLADIYPDDDEFLAKPSFGEDKDPEYDKALAGDLNSDHLEDTYPDKDEFLVREGSEEDDDEDEEEDDLEEFAFDDFDFEYEACCKETDEEEDEEEDKTVKESSDEDEEDDDEDDEDDDEDIEEFAFDFDEF